MSGWGAVQTCVALVMGILALSGCSGAGPDPEDEPGAPQGVSDTTGAVEGIVQDGELAPIPNATVAIMDAELQVSTDAGGAFRLANVKPGTHTLFAQRLGFESTGRSVSVVAGETTQVAITLEPLPVEEAHHETFEQTKRVDWGVRIVPQVGGYAGGDLIWGYETSDRTDAMVDMSIEMTWQGTQALAGGMRLRVEVDGEDNELDYTFCVLEGTSPLTCYTGAGAPEDNITKILENGHDDCPADDTCNIQWRGFTGTGNTDMDVDFGVMVDQEFTVYTTHFYRGFMPEGFSARPDA